MTDNEKREFDHLLNGIKLIIKMHDDTPPHGRFGLPQFQVEAVAALVKQLETQEKEAQELKNKFTTTEEERDDLKAVNTWLEAQLKHATSLIPPKSETA
jgi:hypothetical protein